MIFLDNKISLRQFQILIILDILGSSLVILPRRLADISNQDGWISLLIGILLVLIFTYIMMSIGRLFPKDNFYSYSKKLLTAPIAFVISLIFIMKIIITVGLEIRIFGEMISQIMLNNTPFYVISISMLLVSGLLSSKGIEARARVSEILIIVLLAFLIGVFTLAAFDVDYTNLLPAMSTPYKDIFKGSLIGIFAFSGVEYTLLIYPFLKNKSGARKASMVSIIFLGIIMLAITIICISKFSYIGLQRQLWPVLEMMNSLNMPGSFMDRQDAFVMSFWIIMVFGSLNAGIFFGSILAKDLFKKGSHTNYIFVICIIIFIVSMLPSNIATANIFLEKVHIILDTFFIIFLPLFYLFVAKIRKFKEVELSEN